MSIEPYLFLSTVFSLGNAIGTVGWPEDDGQRGSQLLKSGDSAHDPVNEHKGDFYTNLTCPPILVCFIRFSWFLSSCARSLVFPQIDLSGYDVRMQPVRPRTLLLE